MTNWSVRTRIIVAFAAVIVVMAAMGYLSVRQLSTIDGEARSIDTQAMPAIVAADAELRQGRDVLPKLIGEAFAPPAKRDSAAQATERELKDLGASDAAYTGSASDDRSKQLFAKMTSERQTFLDRYRAAKGSAGLTPTELEALIPDLERYGDAVDSLVNFNRDDGVQSARTIHQSASKAKQTISWAVLLALALAVIAAFLLVRDFTWLIGAVQRSGIQVNSSSTEIAATAKEQQATATEIAATTSEVGATASRISATSKELAHTMNTLAGVAEQTASLASSGQTGLQRMETTMRQIMDASGSISSRLSMLSEKAGNINSVVTTINKVADQTNLLSLNAAIEAEKAGEHGRGFTVVATEIRRLADQTAVATYDIEQIVKEMQSAVSAGVMGMDKFSEEVRRGNDAVGQVTVQLSEIIHQVQTLIPSFESVNEGVQSQSVSAQQISEALAQLSDAAQQTAESLRQSNQAIDQLNEAARGLQGGIARFTPSR